MEAMTQGYEQEKAMENLTPEEWAEWVLKVIKTAFSVGEYTRLHQRIVQAIKEYHLREKEKQ